MKRIITVLSAGLLSVTLAATQIHAAFEDLGWTARSRSLGGAMFAEFSGVDSMNYNPATIALAREIEVYGAWDNPAAGLDDGSSIHTVNFAAVVPFFDSLHLGFDPFVTKRAALGFTVKRWGLYDPSLGGEIYHEGIYSMIYAKDLNDTISRGAKISAGLRFTIYELGIGSDLSDVENNPDLTGSDLSKISFGLDVGITYDFSETIRIGVAYKNLIAPTTSFLTNTEKMATEFRLGANWAIGDLFFMKDFNVGGGIVTYGRDADDNRKAEQSINLGLEFEVVEVESIDDELFAIRLGAVYENDKTGESVFEIAAGTGFRWVFGEDHELNVDYAFEYGINSALMQHTAGMSYSYHLANSKFVYEKDDDEDIDFDALLEEAQDPEAVEAESDTGDLEEEVETTLDELSEASE